MRALRALSTMVICAGCGEPVEETMPPVGACPIGTIAEGAACIEPGVPPELCGEGFEPSEEGCAPILPEMPCPPGLMAVPGDRECREPLACGRSPWGEVATAADTQFVDGSYAGNDSDGSSDRPWQTIQQGIDAAAPGAVVVVAAGDYVEDLSIADKAVALRGRCPTLVTVRAATAPVATLQILQQASGTVVSGLSLSSPTRAVAMSGVEDVVLEHVRIHDTDGTGLIVQDVFGPTSLVVRGALFEGATGAAVIAEGTRVTIEGSNLRDGRPLVEGTFGRGLEAQKGADVSLAGSLLERNRDVGVQVSGSSVRIAASVVRDMLAEVDGSDGGRGVNVQASARVELVSSVVSRAHDVALFVWDSEALVDGTVIGDTLPRESDGLGGYGIVAQGDSTLALQRSLVVRSADGALSVTASNVTVERTHVLATLPADVHFGRGINVQYNQATSAPAHAVIRDTRVEGAHDLGVAFLGATAEMHNVAVIGTLGRLGDGLFGDGILILSEPESAGSAALARVLSDTNMRAGVAVFGAALALAESVLECNPIDLDGELYLDLSPSLADEGGNHCGCDGEQRNCQLLSTGLTPPDPLAPGP